MEVDGTNKIVFIPEASSCVFHPLDLGIERFTTGIRNLMPQVGDDIVESSFQHRRFLLIGSNRLWAAPVIPPLKMLALGPIIATLAIWSKRG